MATKEHKDKETPPMAASEATVKATVVRGTYFKIKDDGTREAVVPGKGKDSEVDVTESQLRAFGGVLARSSEAAALIQQAAMESMAPPTETSDAIVPPTQAGASQAAATETSSSSRRAR